MSTKKAHCNVCGGDRNHDVLHSELTTWEDRNQGVFGGDRYETLKCCGCEAIKLRHVSSFSEDDTVSVTYFPPAVFRRHPEWFEDLCNEIPPGNEFVVSLLNEIYVALHNNLTSLATMGVRALLEKVMISQIGDQGSFFSHVKKFEELGHLSKLQRARLDVILDAGHAAMHRIYSPNSSDVITLLDIAENIIESVFVHDHRVEKLKKNVPIKQSKKAKPPSI
ncbi:DUF4145 domain-containing protein [Comamonas thiooxydans]|uniref:DUF4145 domain-containing protein n=1 Tax=Comamonas thiooxydans TaxID=363952 RepID=A0A0E3BLT7_9BURK|nr:DUF4145 domain-containing protein [Comamonas thiooxydans]KGH02963.1 hypothetical protein P608_25945 [Comamonas thiooxydans]KGH14905.1 hypothetical protein P607_22330 [Comamonas thiooxydans]KGH20021.1 hypothetical protein P606_21700 [Comamonas thiooxydans]